MLATIIFCWWPPGFGTCCHDYLMYLIPMHLMNKTQSNDYVDLTSYSTTYLETSFGFPSISDEIIE